MSTHENGQSCPSNEKRELVCVSSGDFHHCVVRWTVQYQEHITLLAVEADHYYHVIQYCSHRLSNGHIPLITIHNEITWSKSQLQSIHH